MDAAHTIPSASWSPRLGAFKPQVPRLQTVVTPTLPRVTVADVKDKDSVLLTAGLPHPCSGGEGVSFLPRLATESASSRSGRQARDTEDLQLCHACDNLRANN